MGKIDSIYILDNVKCKIANIQELSLKKITELFIEIDVNNLTFDCTEGIGVRGVYEDLPNNQLEIKF